MTSHLVFCDDAHRVVRDLADTTLKVDCVITSPPYWGQRDYGHNGSPAEFGHEATPEDYVQRLVGLFYTLRSTLTPRGVVWLNLGDRYLDKQLLLLPAQVALALQDEGWWLRADVIWHKPNAMPETAARTRPGRAHEHILLLTPTRDHYYDSVAVEEAAAWDRWGDHTVGKTKQGTLAWVKERSREELVSRTTKRLRDVWSIPTKGTGTDHPAPFPEKLVERMILAGCPVGGTVLDPFAGSGTVAAVAQRLGRNSISIELSARWADDIRSRIAVQQEMFRPGAAA